SFRTMLQLLRGLVFLISLSNFASQKQQQNTHQKDHSGSYTNSRFDSKKFGHPSYLQIPDGSHSQKHQHIQAHYSASKLRPDQTLNSCIDHSSLRQRSEACKEKQQHGFVEIMSIGKQSN